MKSSSNRLRQLSDCLSRQATPLRTALLLAVCGGFFWTFNFSGLPFSVPSLKGLANGSVILDLRLWYSPEAAHELMFRLGEAGRRAYVAFLGWDFIFLLVYGAAFGLLISLALRWASLGDSPWRYMNLLPAGIALADALENLATLAQLLAYPRQFPLLASLGSVFTLIKHVGAVLAIMFLILAAAFAVGKRLGRQPTGTT